MSEFIPRDSEPLFRARNEGNSAGMAISFRLSVGNSFSKAVGMPSSNCDRVIHRRHPHQIPSIEFSPANPNWRANLCAKVEYDLRAGWRPPAIAANWPYIGNVSKCLLFTFRVK